MQDCNHLCHVLKRKVDHPAGAKTLSRCAKRVDALGLEGGNHTVEQQARDLGAVLADPRWKVKVRLHKKGKPDVGEMRIN